MRPCLKYAILKINVQWVSVNQNPKWMYCRKSQSYLSWSNSLSTGGNRRIGRSSFLSVKFALPYSGDLGIVEPIENFIRFMTIFHFSVCKICSRVWQHPSTLVRAFILFVSLLPTTCSSLSDFITKKSVLGCTHGLIDWCSCRYSEMSVYELMKYQGWKHTLQEYTSKALFRSQRF